MKKWMWLFTLCLFSPLIALAEEQTEAAQNPPTLTGSYQGRVYSGNDLDPVLTTFYRDEAGQLVGSYAMGEENGLALGELSHFRREGDFTWVADWKDKYGTGVLRMLFSSNQKVFHGFWGNSSAETYLPWDGVKQ